MMINDLPRMQVLITTNEQHIEGELLLPENMRFSNSIPDNMLFYILNGGFLCTLGQVGLPQFPAGQAFQCESPHRSKRHCGQKHQPCQKPSVFFAAHPASPQIR